MENILKNGHSACCNYITISNYTITYVYFLLLTLLGLGLIKINYVSANFINPRFSLILNN